MIFSERYKELIRCWTWWRR